MTTARRRGQKARGKGYRYQEHLARMLREIFTRPQFEVLEGHAKDIHIRDEDGEDVLFIEAKHRKQISVWEALKQAMAAARPGTPAAAVCLRKASEGAVVVMDAGDFIELLRGWAPPIIV